MDQNLRRAQRGEPELREVVEAYPWGVPLNGEAFAPRTAQRLPSLRKFDRAEAGLSSALHGRRFMWRMVNAAAAIGGSQSKLLSSHQYRDT